MIGADSLPPWPLALVVPAIAFLYASVGFGGASGYLAAMSLFMISPPVMSSTALLLNLLVSSIAFLAYYRASHFTPRLLWPFVLTSIPAAFLGGFIPFPTDLYLILLYISLSYIAIRMLFSRPKEGQEEGRLRTFPIWAALLAGGVIGLLSGIIGIGGGIFLSPLIILASWGTPKQAAASSAAFIFINSSSGLIGRFAGGNLEIGLLGFSLIPLGLLGALGGGRLGARALSGQAIRRLLGVILLIVVLRYWTFFLF